MATHIAWLLNFDADLELQAAAKFRPLALSLQRRSELMARVTDLIAAEDVVLPDIACDVATTNSTNRPTHDHHVQAFCPTPSALRHLEQLGLSAPAAPSFAVLRQVNDRAFCAALGHGLPDSCFARDMATLERHLARVPSAAFVIKRAFSFAGRAQRRVHAGQLDASTRGFCARSFARGEGVQVEPWVERLTDVSKHGYLTAAGELLVGASREQRCDALGRYLGSSMTPALLSAEEEQRFATELNNTAAALRDAGYFGPFGIDGFRYRHPLTQTAFNPRCEINARFTLGYSRALLLEALSTRPAPGD